MSGSGKGGRLRHIVPALVGLGLFGLGLYALHHLLAPVNPGDILRQMRATPWHVLGVAFGATALGYMALIGYDFWALIFLEKKLPLRVVALGGFLGYAFGNTIGVSVLSGGAVRYRIYSAFGLNAFEVAALASYIAIAMGTGLSLVGVFALSLHPGALTGLIPLSEGTIRLLALLGGGGTLGLLYALAFSGKTLKLRRFELSMPNAKILTGQMVVALFEFDHGGADALRPDACGHAGFRHLPCDLCRSDDGRRDEPRPGWRRRVRDGRDGRDAAGHQCGRSGGGAADVSHDLLPAALHDRLRRRIAERGAAGGRLGRAGLRRNLRADASGLRRAVRAGALAGRCLGLRAGRLSAGGVADALGPGAGGG
ncbi:lysylphosphatidylglycerol synthase transmembrane domain-containing protein [Paenirhodobacter sp.]|uniref:lysylphosphatidylglycerol synthase transmembrane domain-containing protein n=1 Tax=Paenirhodobacter sp. TaxID=1965326 RepID=UPI003B3C8E4A